jgi:Leucine-rich repeat (LRR) protein
MQKLMLAGNELANLPSEMGQLHNLELLRLSVNRLTRLPGKFVFPHQTRPDELRMAYSTPSLGILGLFW